ncbi:putative toxin-antitoxin system toxin component, PIN family [Brevibacillus borstelensis]|jgi:putative PIN family toxin of toxin-antitoxin system|uniref:putative toxin-antitoxin system toxin component, PIN family n=1 Tax=Brevibacillus TaxID=55080 RepID=UPI00046A6F05|nr:putative toxin-antitoxin system toxin component, PIN family [Brevibacillus borstelensis]
MRVIIDTSSFIRAIIENDLIAWECLQMIMAYHQQIASAEMAKELLVAIYQVSGRKGKNPLPAFRMAALYLLGAEQVEPDYSYSWCFDPGDAMFIECAICGGAKVVISNDRSLTTLHEYVTDEEGKRLIQEIEFLTPEEFVRKYSLS